MSHSKNLRAAESILATSRQRFIQSLENKKKFEEECAVIIPELDNLWKEKILSLIGPTIARITPLIGLPGVGQNGRTPVVGPPMLDETQTVNWRHYLFNYRPQLLTQAVTRLASRIKLVDGEIHNSRGKVENLSAYYKAIVQDLRHKEAKREKTRTALGLDPTPSSATADYIVGQVTPLARAESHHVRAKVDAVWNEK